MVIKQEADVRTEQGATYSAVHVGPMSGLDNHKLELPHLNRKVRGKLFIKDYLAMTGMQISMNKFPPGISVPFYHTHIQNEEAYIFTKGRGQMQIDGKTIDVEEGSIVRIATGGVRCLRNNGAEDLHFICIQAKENSLTQDTFEDGQRTETEVVWPD